jgi:hypothetical protein
MRVEAAKQAASERTDTRSGVEPDPHQGEGRALVALETPAASAAATHYREAAFLAHLIATKVHAPQTRERRRVDPGEAIAAYRAAASLTLR